jgi:hypothetical protein
MRRDERLLRVISSLLKGSNTDAMQGDPGAGSDDRIEAVAPQTAVTTGIMCAV